MLERDWNVTWLDASELDVDHPSDDTAVDAFESMAAAIAHLRARLPRLKSAPSGQRQDKGEDLAGQLEKLAEDIRAATRLRQTDIQRAAAGKGRAAAFRCSFCGTHVL